MRPKARQIIVATPAVALFRLRRAASPAVHHVIARLGAHGGEAFIVGGAVRDAFLGRAIKDFDVATSLPPAEVAALFARVVRAGEKHGTIMVLVGEERVEVTTMREDGAYKDGRRPASVSFGASIEADLGRRDFTVNAMAADLTRGLLIDPYGGARDLARRLLRSVGDPVTRFEEDGLRPLRAVRFAGVLGLCLCPKTRRAIPKTLASFARVSWERKRDEMSRLLAEGHDFGSIGRLLCDTGLLGALAEELIPGAQRLAVLDKLPPARPWLRFAAFAARAGLKPTQAREILRRWRVSTRDLEGVEAWLEALAALPPHPLGAKELRRWLAAIPKDRILDATLLGRALCRGQRDLPARTSRVLARRPALDIADLEIDGRDLADLGFKGVEIGATLRALLDLVLDTPRHNDRAYLLAAAKNLHRVAKCDTR